MIRRAPLIVLAALLALLAWVPVSLADDPATPQVAPLGAPAAEKAAAPATQTAAGPCEVDGQVLSAGGSPIAGADVYVFYEAAGKTVIADWTQTGADGAFSVTGVPETAAGEIDVYLPSGNSFWASGLTYTAAGPNRFVLRPGYITARLDRRPAGSWRPPFVVHTYGSGGGSTSHVTALAGRALAAAPDLTYAIAYTYDNQAIEWFAASPRKITAGASGGSIPFRLADARGAWVTAPRWASGRPGTSVTIALNHWPKGARIGFSGSPAAPSGTVKAWSPTTASGRETITRRLTIPRSAPAGYSYTVFIRHLRTGSHLEFPLTFQVASLASSRATLARGQAIRLRGTVPTQGHWGPSTPGKTKLVTVYRRTSAAGQPKHWNARSDGWTAVGTYRTDGLGRFTTGYFKPARTTWYVASYAGDAEYHPGFTSVARVRVK